VAALPLAVLAAASLLTACSGSDEQPVGVGEVGRATVVEMVEAPATAVARAAAVVTAPATGTVRTLRVRDGQQVRRGQTLLVVDSPATEAALARARQAAASASVPVGLQGLELSGQRAQADAAARQAFARARAAARQIADPQLRAQALAQVDQAQAQYEAAVAQSRSVVDQVNQGVSSLGAAVAALSRAQQVQVQAAVTAAQAAVDALTVTAPIAGTVVLGASSGGGSSSDVSGLVSSLPESLAGQAASLLGGSGASGGSTTGALEAGSPVTSGDPLLAITDVSTMSLTAQVDETDVLLVTPGVKADVEFDAVPGASYRAVVRNVDLTPTTSSRGGVSYVVRLDLGGGTTASGSPAPRPRPGMSAVASLRVKVSRDTVAVPVSAVFRDGDRDAVWLVVDGVARKTDVVLGAQGEDLSEVLEGVSEGDRVVVTGADRVQDGQELP
jgi:HlyD family secretion protein